MHSISFFFISSGAREPWQFDVYPRTYLLPASASAQLTVAGLAAMCPFAVMGSSDCRFSPCLRASCRRPLSSQLKIPPLSPDVFASLRVQCFNRRNLISGRRHLRMISISVSAVSSME